MNPTVLLVDDNHNLLRGLMRTLSEQPLDVICARSAEEAMHMLKRKGVDVIVSDESMQGMKGTELLCWVAEHFPETARIILTGQPSVPSMQAAINEAGVYRYLLKPVKELELVKTIWDALEMHATDQAAASGN
ncbi:response regulator [Mariniblastus fucicola]|uniref:Hydrogenase transcriptional regulatory protein hupR1 n=1 Tax=Mariniblastus fucicola TaxID=980251 RepID=A0A5B9PCE6_9BACT|nr:response regulator [Mariniblastus fucicola]QEG23159.1 Hydrogenase transcriptional regulatory protein hupR1 [Mariniblastus fucicola]